MNLNKILSEDELTELEDFLNSDKTPKNCMSLDMLDGLITCIAIGPETIMPSIWMKEIWGRKPEDEMIWDSIEEMQKITELILRHYQSTVQLFDISKNDFQPLITIDENDKPYIEGWAIGFWIGIGLSEAAWEIIFEDEEGRKLLYPIYLFGSESGYKIFEEKSQIQEIDNIIWEEYLTKSVIGIYDYWLPRRKIPIQTEVSPVLNIGRNEPCPCGSGKKFKKCCLNKMPNA